MARKRTYKSKGMVKDFVDTTMDFTKLMATGYGLFKGNKRRK